MERMNVKIDGVGILQVHQVPNTLHLDCWIGNGKASYIL